MDSTAHRDRLAGSRPRRLISINLPNLISLARLLSVPLAVWLIIEREYAGAFWVFLAAGVSDAVDGFLAKRFAAQTVLGAYIDPLADKALLVSVYVSLGIGGELPVWLVILVVFRDAMIVGGLVFTHIVMAEVLRMRPIWVSKLNTTAQITLAAGLLASLGFGIDTRGLLEIMVYAVAVTTLLSGGAYLVWWARDAGRMNELK